MPPSFAQIISANESHKGWYDTAEAERDSCGSPDHDVIGTKDTHSLNRRTFGAERCSGAVGQLVSGS